VPQYANVTLGGTVNALPWDGVRGGVLVLDVAGTLTLNSRTLNAAGRGFRGGGGKKYGGSAATTDTDYRTSNAVTVSASKGEGIAGTPRYTLSGPTITAATVVDNSTAAAAFGTTAVDDGYPNGDNGRGAPGNAGGGGTGGGPTANGLNARGVGGSNANTSGLGGSPRNADGSATPVTTVRALGGVTLPSSPTRLVMGGGAGSSNDGNGDAGSTGLYSSGAPGGGIIMVRTGSVSGTGTAIASGAGGYTLQGVNANGVVTNNATGGGAGGTVLVTAKTGAMSGLAVTVGGAGSSNVNAKDVAHGPGGGGSGGIVSANAALGTVTVTGGAADTTTYNNNLAPTATGPDNLDTHRGRRNGHGSGQPRHSPGAARTTPRQAW